MQRMTLLAVVLMVAAGILFAPQVALTQSGTQDQRFPGPNLSQWLSSQQESQLSQLHAQLFHGRGVEVRAVYERPVGGQRDHAGGAVRPGCVSHRGVRVGIDPRTGKVLNILTLTAHHPAMLR